MKSKLRAICAAVAFLLAFIAPQMAFAQAALMPNGEQCFQATTGITGMVGLLGTITGGYNGPTGTTVYGGVALTGGTGTGATANVTVTYGTVTAVAILNPGAGYTVGDVLSALSSNIGNVLGFSVPVSSTSINSSLAGGTVGMYIPGTLTYSQTWQNSTETTLNTNPIQLDANGCAVIYGAGTYRQIVYDSLGNEIWDKLTTVNASLSSSPCASGGVPLAVYNNTQLSALSSTAAACVQRFGFAAIGDSPPVFYAEATNCPYNGGVADGGSCVQTSDHKFWVLQYQPVLDSSEWGVNTTNVDNASAFQNMFGYASVNGGQITFTTKNGQYNVASTFDCKGASNWTWTGEGYGTVIYRTGNYGSTMTCTGASNIKVANVYFLQYIGSNPASSFSNPTAGAAHFLWTNVDHFVFDHVAAWNANYDFEIISSFDGVWWSPYTQGYWDGTNDQTIAEYWFDGTDGTGLGHPKTMAIHDPIMDGYYNVGSTTFTSGAISNTVTNYVTPLGAYDNVLVTSLEGLTIDGVGSADKAFNADLHLEPRGVAGKPILQIHSNGMWWDGAGNAAIEIENAGASSCVANSAAIGVSITGGLIDGEAASNYGIYVANATCPSVYGFDVTGVESVGLNADGYYILGAKGANITGGTVRGYNWWGTYYNNVAASSGIYIGGSSSDVLVQGVGVGGGDVFDAPSSAIGAAVTATNGTGWNASSSGTETWAGAGCATPPVLNVAISAGGVPSVTSIATPGSCQQWPYYGATTWTPSGIGSGSGASFALSPGLNTSSSLTVPNESTFGVSFSAGLTNVVRQNILNNGYYTDFPSQQISCTAGTGTPIYSVGIDNRHGKITTASGSGSVTTVGCAFYGNLLPTANVTCHAFDALTSGGTPVAAAMASGASSPNYTGFNILTASSIGGGGSVSFVCDGMN